MSSGITRIFLFAAILASFPIYFVFLVPEGLLIQVAGAVIILLLISLSLFTGKKPIQTKEKKSEYSQNQPTDFGDVELPSPILSEETTNQMRDSKLRRSRGKSSDLEPMISESSEVLPPLPTPSGIEDISLIAPQDEDVHSLAKVHVAKSDPEMLAEAEVDQYLAQQRARRAVFRERLYRERRIEKSNRLANELRKWAEIEDGEDLSTLTGVPNHGLAIMFEPEFPSPDIPQGISYVRIDDNRILKVRVSLDVHSSMAESASTDIDVPLQDLPTVFPNSEIPMPPPPLPEPPSQINPED